MPQTSGRRGSVRLAANGTWFFVVDLTEPGSARFLLSSSHKVAGQDWVGYHTMQSRSTSPDWVTFVEGSTPGQLALFGFPPPGHPIWSAALIDATARLYPKLDLGPWRSMLGD